MRDRIDDQHAVAVLVQLLECCENFGNRLGVQHVEVEPLGVDLALRHGLPVEGGPKLGVDVGDALAGVLREAL